MERVGKTIGEFIEIDDNNYMIDYQKKAYMINKTITSVGTVFSFPNCGMTKDDIKFMSLFRGVIVKSIYCINCGVCTANCSSGCIDMSKGVKIANSCSHCYQCHDIQEYCLRYNFNKEQSGRRKKDGRIGQVF